MDTDRCLLEDFIFESLEIISEFRSSHLGIMLQRIQYCNSLTLLHSNLLVSGSRLRYEIVPIFAEISNLVFNHCTLDARSINGFVPLLTLPKFR